MALGDSCAKIKMCVCVCIVRETDNCKTAMLRILIFSNLSCTVMLRISWNPSHC